MINLTAFKTLIANINKIPIEKIISTFLLLNRVSKVAPTKPPITPPATIYGNISKLNTAKPVVTFVVISEDNCENKMINNELILASLKDIEKTTVKIATFNGPPPIPKKAAIIPKQNPMNKIVSVSSNS